jgi:hypothetical protein
MRRSLPLAPLALVAASACLVASAGCRDDELYAGAFDMPTAAAVLHPDEGGPMAAHEPVGFVANGIGGRIVLLALKQGRFLTDDASASFLRTNDLPTGGLRLLSSVAPYAPRPYDVQVFAGDTAFEQLVMVPWVTGYETVEGRVQPVEGYASYYPPDLAGAPGVELTDIEVKKGYTTTERFTLTYDGTAWTVEGSRSGRQPTQALPDERFVAEERRIAFTLTGEAEPGAVITIDTWNGLEEYDVGGAPLALSMQPDQSLLAMIVHDRVEDRSVVRWFDPEAKRVTGTVNLPDGSVPHRMEWSEGGDLLYVADAGLPHVWTLSPGAAGGSSIPMPQPVLDVATLDDDDGNTALFVVSADGRTLQRFDAATGEQTDNNPLLPGVQGLSLDSPAEGIAALRQSSLLPEYTDDERRRSGRTVAVSLAKGSVVFAHEDTGCLVQDSLGPRTVSEGGFTETGDYELNFDTAFGPYLAQNVSSGRHVVVNPCGIANNDTWTLRYDQNLGGWRVRSELTGDQQAIAWEDERYVSDGGEVSFTVRAGPAASIDGMEMSFVVDAGIAEANGDADLDGDREVELAIPSDPVPFHYEVGRRDGDFYRVDDRPHALVLGRTSDIVGRVETQEASIDAAWQ